MRLHRAKRATVGAENHGLVDRGNRTWKRATSCVAP